MRFFNFILLSSLFILASDTQASRWWDKLRGKSSPKVGVAPERIIHVKPKASSSTSLEFDTISPTAHNGHEAPRASTTPIPAGEREATHHEALEKKVRSGKKLTNAEALKYYIRPEPFEARVQAIKDDFEKTYGAYARSLAEGKPQNSKIHRRYESALAHIESEQGWATAVRNGHNAKVRQLFQTPK